MDNSAVIIGASGEDGKFVIPPDGVGYRHDMWSEGPKTLQGLVFRVKVHLTPMINIWQLRAAHHCYIASQKPQTSIKAFRPIDVKLIDYMLGPQGEDVVQRHHRAVCDLLGQLETEHPPGEIPLEERTVACHIMGNTNEDMRHLGHVIVVLNTMSIDRE